MSSIDVNFGKRVMLLRRFFSEYPKVAGRIMTKWLNTDVKQRMVSNVESNFEMRTEKLINTISRMNFTVRDTIEPDSSSIIRIRFHQSLRHKVPYAGIHEFGGTIKPKRRQWLTIPMDTILDSRGVATITARDVPNKFFARRGDNLYMFNADEPRRPYFLLKKEVRIPARPYYRPAIHSTVDNLRMTFKKEISKRLRNG